MDKFFSILLVLGVFAFSSWALFSYAPSILK